MMGITAGLPESGGEHIDLLIDSVHREILKSPSYFPADRDLRGAKKSVPAADAVFGSGWTHVLPQEASRRRSVVVLSS